MRILLFVISGVNRLLSSSRSGAGMSISGLTRDCLTLLIRRKSMIWKDISRRESLIWVTSLCLPKLDLRVRQTLGGEGWRCCCSSWSVCWGIGSIVQGAGKMLRCIRTQHKINCLKWTANDTRAHTAQHQTFFNLSQSRCLVFLAFSAETGRIHNGLRRTGGSRSHTFYFCLANLGMGDCIDLPLSRDFFFPSKARWD